MTGESLVEDLVGESRERRRVQSISLIIIWYHAGS